MFFLHLSHVNGISYIGWQSPILIIFPTFNLLITITRLIRAAFLRCITKSVDILRALPLFTPNSCSRRYCIIEAQFKESFVPLIFYLFLNFILANEYGLKWIIFLDFDLTLWWSFNQRIELVLQLLLPSFMYQSFHLILFFKSLSWCLENFTFIWTNFGSLWGHCWSSGFNFQLAVNICTWLFYIIEAFTTHSAFMASLALRANGTNLFLDLLSWPFVRFLGYYFEVLCDLLFRSILLQLASLGNLLAKKLTVVHLWSKCNSIKIDLFVKLL